VHEQDALDVTMTQMGYSELPMQARVQGNRTDFTVTEELYREPTVERVAYIGEDGALTLR